MYEVTADDLTARAREMAEKHAKAVGAKRDRQKAPLWFLAIHAEGALFRVCWFGPNGAAYSITEELEHG